VVRSIAARDFPELVLEVDSAGIADYHVGEPPDRRAVAVARRRGYDQSDQRARQLRQEDFERFDHVLAMDRANLSELEIRRPRDARARVALFLRFAAEGGREDVPDPYYGGSEEFERVLDLCEAGARGLLARLREPTLK
jgi:protein-tyrosine phosphatase